MFFQNILKSKVCDQSIQERKKLSRDIKEFFVQRFMKVFDQNWKHVEVWNQRTGTPIDFTVPW